MAEPDGRLFEAAEAGDAAGLAALLDRCPEKLGVRKEPYAWTLLHAAAAGGHLAAVDLLLRRGLVGQGARHHIFSAIAMDLADEVRRIVAADPGALNRRMSRNEDHQLPLHFAVRKDRADMAALLLELGADPLGVDASGHTAAACATSPGADRPVMEAIRTMTAAELLSAERGRRRPRAGMIDLVAALALGDHEAAARLVREIPGLIERGGPLHLMAKRDDAAAVRWLLDHGADPNARWSHWDDEVRPLHLAVLGDHAHIVHLLLEAGADPRIRDSTHDADARGWAEFFQRPAIVGILEAHSSTA